MSKPIAFVVLLGVAALCVPYFGTEYAVSFTIQLMVFTILAYSWNLIGGYAGYTHFGQICFFGLGGYVGALLIQKAGMPWYFAVPVAALSGIALALPLGTAMLRLKGPVFRHRHVRPGPGPRVAGAGLRLHHPGRHRPVPGALEQPAAGLLHVGGESR